MTPYLMNKTESPALSLFAPTNKLHPVVRRCRFGWPKMNEHIIGYSQETELMNQSLQKAGISPQ